MQTFQSKPNHWRIFLVAMMFYASFAVAQSTSPPVSTLKGVAIPTPSTLSTYVANVTAAKALGKALFWDMAVGSDGVQACASCHFHAGADNRAKNQLDPALNHQTVALRNVFNPTKSNNVGGPNFIVNKRDFPFHVLSNPLDRNSSVVFDTNDILSSQGVFPRRATGTSGNDGPYLPTPGANSETCVHTPDGIFHVGTPSTRKVEPRNSPTTINAVFNFRNFWDGRANQRFNGGSPFGDRDPQAYVYLLAGQSGMATGNKVSIDNASLASQAVGPPTSEFEMSCSGREFFRIAKRLLSRKALLGQEVSASDSLLASYRNTTGTGLNTTYEDLIKQAFLPQYWNVAAAVNCNGYSCSQIEMNFSLFFGLAVQLYESTLVSDDAPIDRFLDSAGTIISPGELTAQEQRGRLIFGLKADGTPTEQGQGKCIQCHNGPQLTNAGTPAFAAAQQNKLIERMVMGDGALADYDQGFYNIGVRPTIEDLGVGANGPFGPLSFTRSDSVAFRDAVDGAFKVPTLRNVELTGPYFHNGSRKTLEEVIEFYNRGGDRRGPNGNDTTGFGPNLSNLDPDIQPLGLIAAQQADLVAFLKRPLTDDRVRCDKAPFDHPEIRVPNGHTGNNFSVIGVLGGVAEDMMLIIPAVGSGGMCGAGNAGQRLPFDQTLAP